MTVDQFGSPHVASNVEAWLLSLPEEVPTELPPSPSEIESLPLNQLSFRDAERLFLCVLKTQCEVSYAKSYGTVGQKQEGIDVYGRLKTWSPTPENIRQVKDCSHGENSRAECDTCSAHAARPYVVLQSKRVKNVAPSDIAAAVDKFLEGTWPKETSQFYYATTFDFRETSLDQAVRDATDKLQSKNIQFIPWDAECVNELLRDQPRLVERFFGRLWVARFCGEDALNVLSHHELDAVETRRLRTELHGLYRAVFKAVSSLTPQGSAGRERFVMLDVLPQTSTKGLGWEEIRRPIADKETMDRDGNPDKATVEGIETESDPQFTSSILRRSRRSLRSVRNLIEDRSQRAVLSGAIAADRWLAESDQCLLVGIPGAGKSSILRFVATDLLDAEPVSAALQRRYSDCLPVWLPFGFLCHHLEESQANSLTSAVRTWLTSCSRDDIYPLVEKALKDDRLLLLIDGIDEWTSEGAANNALGVIETFLGNAEASAILTSRPYALARLPFSLTWQQANVAPLDSEQQRAIASQHLVPHSQFAQEPDEASGSEHEKHAIMWSSTNVEPFLAQLTSLTDLQSFAQTPLLLALLARIWRGEPLPPRRFDLYNKIIHMLIDTHPKMRARASKASSQALSVPDFMTLIQAVAYRLKADELPPHVPTKTLQKVVEAALVDEEILGYGKADARKMAAEAMTMAEDEFGILVAQGAQHVSFVHRVIGDHLAGCHLAELDTSVQRDFYARKHGDAAWTDVLLAALNAQTSRPAIAATLDAVLDTLQEIERSEVPWPTNILRRQATWSFIGESLGADIKLVPRKARALIDRLMNEVESSTFLEHRADLIVKLVQTASTSTHWRYLLPTFQRWLNATRPDPGPAMWSLRDIPFSDEDRIRRTLIHGIHHDDGVVRSNAVTSYATRYGNLTASETIDLVTDPRPVDPALLEVINAGPSARTQAAALLTLALGWPGSEETREQLTWGRGMPKTNIRSVALYATAEGNKDTPLVQLFDEDEYAFVMEHLYQEHRFIEDHDRLGLNFRLVKRAVSEASAEEKERFAEYAADTLRERSRNGGSREVCWSLASGPLAAYEAPRDWAIEELAKANDKNPLIIYDLNLIPELWLEHQPMKDALHARIDDLLENFVLANARLTRALSDDQARSALLKALDHFRPANVAYEILERFPDDPSVTSELDKRFANDEQAAVLASIAMDYLGPSAGFDRIFSLLRNFNATDPSHPSENHIVVGAAVASGWNDLQRAASGESSDIDPATAARILERYDDNEVAAACVAIPTNGLGWHIDHTIQTWPGMSVDYTLNELRSNRHTLHGVSDSIHSAALRAHAGHPTPRSHEVLDLALDLMTPLPAELREVLVHELAKSPITPPQLLDAISCWNNDLDGGVRSTAAIGITQALVRHHQSDRPPSMEFNLWRETVRKMLCAYGPTYDGDRQIAWICMLLLGEPSLLDGVRETIGDESPVGVGLTDLSGTPVDLLVELIGQNWVDLVPHLGARPLGRLTGTREKLNADGMQALRALVGTASNAPGIAELLRQRITDESESASESPTRLMIETTPGGIDHLMTEEGHTGANLERILHICASDDGDHYPGELSARWALTRLLEPWDISAADLETTLRKASTQETPQQFHQVRYSTDNAIARTALTILFPHNEAVRERLLLLEEEFTSIPDSQPLDSRFTWLEAIALAFAATPAKQLPLYLERLFDLRRLEISRQPMWKFTTPLFRRLNSDPNAIPELVNALDGAAPLENSPLLLPSSLARCSLEDRTARRVFLVARTLKAVGQLNPAKRELAMSTLRKADPRLPVVDPFIDETGPLQTLGVTLADG